MKEFFEPRRVTGTINITLTNGRKWHAQKAAICGAIIDIVELFQDDGYTLTLRQLYYQLVAADHIPNDDKVYKKLSGILDDMRYSGLIDWDAIEDRGRVPYLPYYANSPQDAISDLVHQYRLDRQDGQPTLIEVWTEKDAISGILKRTTSMYHVRLVVNKGYSSSTAMYNAYKRFVRAIKDGQSVQVLYFGDHDPSGLDMVRDINDRIKFFISHGAPAWLTEHAFAWYEDADHDIFSMHESGYIPDSVLDDYAKNGGIESDDQWQKWEAGKVLAYITENNLFEVVQIGLTREQIREYNPPPNPAKITDPRAKWYLAEHGTQSWEVDALRPDVMTRIVSQHIAETLDQDLYDSVVAAENEHKAKMKKFSETFDNDQ